LKKSSEYFKYVGEKTNQISFPLGGIGTGCIGLAGNGRLIDWEIFNRPNKNSSVNGFSFFAIKAETKKEVKVARVINGDMNEHFIGHGHNDWEYGFGVKREYLAGLPHFKNSEFVGEFPVAKIDFKDENVDLDVKLTAFNPYIPQNDKDSSLPCAVFSFDVTNNYDEELDVSLVSNIGNPHDKGAKNEYFEDDKVKGIKLYSESLDEDDAKYGDISIATIGEDVSKQCYWYRGEWFDNLTVFWSDFTKLGKFEDRVYDKSSDKKSWNATVNFLDTALLANHKTIKPGQTKTFKFVLTWNYPNFINYWNPNGEDGSLYQWKNYYATLFENSTNSVSYVFNNWERLNNDTMLFKKTLFDSTLPDYVIDAISANISILKSPTCIRLEDGTFYGFEGSNIKSGCCVGTCTHVWNYAQANAFLFPELERGMRDVDFKANQFDSGKMSFRMLLPITRDKEKEITDFTIEAGKAAVDGQMGGVIKSYREWKISGDNEWLKKIWPKVKKSLEYAWSEENEERWDYNCDGVIEGTQHHTLDVDMFGPNSFLSGYYLTALLAASEMAKAVGDNSSKKYYDLYERGKKWVDNNLFNGEYYHQLIDITDEKYELDKEFREVKYQIGEGCHIDQIIGQWYSHVISLGHILDKDNVKKALLSIYKHNFIDCLREYANTYRVYALNDERGVVICTWPKGNSPKVPVPYSNECMSGMEYQFACHMIYEGLIEEGLDIVSAVRDRFDGKRRNPWNEFECGSNYARAMSSYSLLLALSGFKYDIPNKLIRFTPVINEDNFKTFFSVSSAWGEFAINNSLAEINVLFGNIVISNIMLDDRAKNIDKITFDKEVINAEVFDNVIKLDRKICMQKGSSIRITFKKD